MMIQKDVFVKGSCLLMLGLAFKENCPDLRNTRVVDVLSELRNYDIKVDVHDLWVDSDEAVFEHGITLKDEPSTEDYDGVIFAVAHDCYLDAKVAKFRGYERTNYLFFDHKSVFPCYENDLRLGLR